MTLPLIHNQLLKSSSDLQDMIKFFWYVKIPRDYPFQGEMVFPNGHIVLMLNLSDVITITEFSPGGPVLHSFLSVLFGQHERGFWIEKTGELEVLCIYLNTEFLHHYCRTDISVLSHMPLIDPETVLGKISLRLEEEGRLGKTLVEKINLVENVFRKEISLNYESDMAFLAAKQLIFQSGGQLFIEKVSNKVGIPYKTLQRKFTRLLGITPKSYARAIRFNSSYHHWVTGHFDDMLGLAIDQGYYDQNHFIKEFKHFLHRTPTAHAGIIDQNILLKGEHGYVISKYGFNQ